MTGINWLVDNHHVSDSNIEIVRDIWNHLKKGLPKEIRKNAYKKAIDRHNKNKELFFDVMGGNLK